MSNQIEDFYKSMQQSFSSTPTLMHPALRAQAHAREQEHARAEYTEETKHRVAESRKRYLTEQKEKKVMHEMLSAYANQLEESTMLLKRYSEQNSKPAVNGGPAERPAAPRAENVLRLDEPDGVSEGNRESEEAVEDESVRG